MTGKPTPTNRELEILKILWDRGEASVRTVYEELSKTAPIVQNTVQALLRIMDEKDLVRHRVDGRTFIYTPNLKREQANKMLMTGMLNRVFDGAIEQLVQCAIAARQPSEDELKQLEALIKNAKKKK